MRGCVIHNMLIQKIEPDKKNRLLVYTDEIEVFPIYRSEAKAYRIEEGTELSEAEWNTLCEEVLKKRVIKRAMFLLQKMDRTEAGLRRKLKENRYPDFLIDSAVDYVKSYHYIDDLRYASSYICYHQSEKSRLQLKFDLQKKGVSSDLIEQAFEAEYRDNEDQLIDRLLEKKHYDAEKADQKEKMRVYQYLARRGFSGSAIRRRMGL